MIDSHVHVAAADTERYPRVRRSGDKPGWWDGPSGVEELLAAMDESGVDRAVVVQSAGVYGFDCRYTIDAAARDTTRLAAVVAVDTSQDPTAAIGQLAAEPTVRSLRLMAIEPWGTSWVSEPVADRIWKLAGAHGLSVLVVAGTSELAPLRPVIAANPGVTTVFDNAGMPHLDADGRVPGDHPVLALAELPNVCIKVLTPLLQAPSALDQLVSFYGAERVAWGSNFPQTPAFTYSDLVALAREATSALRPTDQEAVLEATSARLWF